MWWWPSLVLLVHWNMTFFLCSRWHPFQECDNYNFQNEFFSFQCSELYICCNFFFFLNYGAGQGIFDAFESDMPTESPLMWKHFTPYLYVTIFKSAFGDWVWQYFVYHKMDVFILHWWNKIFISRTDIDTVGCSPSCHSMIKLIRIFNTPLLVFLSICWLDYFLRQLFCI